VASLTLASTDRTDSLKALQRDGPLGGIEDWEFE
jgi:hypothetical protein